MTPDFHSCPCKIERITVPMAKKTSFIDLCSTNTAQQNGQTYFYWKKVENLLSHCFECLDLRSSLIVAVYKELINNRSYTALDVLTVVRLVTKA